MASEGQQKPRKKREEEPADGEDLLRDLGWQPTAHVTPLVTAIPVVDDGERFCSFCWTRLLAAATECHDCGHTVAEMEADRAARAEADRNWIPPRRQPGAPQAVRRAAPVMAAAVPGANGGAAIPVVAIPQPDLPSLQRYQWKDLAMAVGVGSFLGGASVSVAWFVILGLPSFGNPAGASGLVVPGAGVTPPGIQIRWQTPYPELRAELLTPTGEVAASSSAQEPSAQPIEPGVYRIRISDRAGRWHMLEREIRVDPGQVITVAPTADAASTYYLWLGKRLHRREDLRGAERAWREAIQAEPHGIEARLQLAALLAVRYRYPEARAQLRQILAVAPRERRAHGLLRTLDRIGAGR